MRESHISPRLRERSLEGRRSNQNQLQPINTNALNKIIQIKNSILHNILKCKLGAEARYALRGPWPPQNFLKPQ